MSATIAQRIAQFVHEPRFEDLPPEVVEKTKLLVLDTLGVAIGSSRMDFGRAALGLVSRWGGAQEASLIGAPGLVPAQAAAFANGVLSHGQDYDDTHTESVVHSSAALVPAALAAAQRHRRGGRDVIAALAVGSEVTIRLGLPALNRFHLRGFHTTSICATFGASAIAARLAGFDRDRTVQALGVDGSFTSGLLECIGAGAGAKRLHAGWAALCGLVAADLATEGYTGPETVFEGRLGLYNSFLRGERVDLDRILAGLGERWELLDIRPKLYPCCHYLQSFLDCAARLREGGVKPDMIEAIRCTVAAGAANIVCEPWAGKLAPKSAYDCRFSLPFAVSLMFVRGRAGADDFAESSIADPAIRDLMGKVSYDVEPRFEVKDMPGRIDVTLVDGTTRSHEIAEVRGHARDPVARDELLEKFNDNTRFLGRVASEELAGMILGLDQLEQVDPLMQSAARQE